MPIDFLLDLANIDTPIAVSSCTKSPARSIFPSCSSYKPHTMDLYLNTGSYTQSVKPSDQRAEPFTGRLRRLLSDWVTHTIFWALRCCIHYARHLRHACTVFDADRSKYDAETIMSSAKAIIKMDETRQRQMRTVETYFHLRFISYISYGE